MILQSSKFQIAECVKTFAKSLDQCVRNIKVHCWLHEWTINTVHSSVFIHFSNPHTIQPTLHPRSILWYPVCIAFHGIILTSLVNWYWLGAAWSISSCFSSKMVLVQRPSISPSHVTEHCNGDSVSQMLVLIIYLWWGSGGMNPQWSGNFFSCPRAHSERMADHFMGLIYSRSERQKKLLDLGVSGKK